MARETYSIDYRGRYPLQLMYRTGYSVDYLPYLKIDGLNYRAAGINIKSSFGIGKIANKEVSSECLRLDMNLSKSLISRDNFQSKAE